MLSVSSFDLNLLGVFEAIYAKGGVTAAARQLNLSQSAVSHALARLRRAFDDPLFIRSGNALVPTTLAQSIVGPVRDALRGVELAVLAATSFDPARSTRSFGIGLRQSIETRMFVDLVALAAAQAPTVGLTSVNFVRGEMERDLAQGTLDVAIDVRTSRATGLRTQQLRTDDLVVVARPGHPLVSDRLTLDDYIAARHVVASPRPAGLGTEDEALATIGARRTIAVRCQHIWAAWRIVAQSDMILTLMRSNAEAMQHIAPLQIAALPIDVPPHSLQLYWHEASERDPGNRWLRALITDCFAAMSTTES